MAVALPNSSTRSDPALAGSFKHSYPPSPDSWGEGLGVSGFGNGMEFAPAGVLRGAFLAMATPVRDPSSLTVRIESIVEMRCDAENKQKQIPLPPRRSRLWSAVRMR